MPTSTYEQYPGHDKDKTLQKLTQGDKKADAAIDSPQPVSNKDKAKQIARQSSVVAAKGVWATLKGIWAGLRWSGGKVKKAAENRNARVAERKAKQAENVANQKLDDAKIKQPKKKRGFLKKAFVLTAVGVGGVWGINQLDPDDLKLDTGFSLDLSAHLAEIQTHTKKWGETAQAWTGGVLQSVDRSLDSGQALLSGVDPIIDFTRGLPMHMGENAFESGVADAIVREYNDKCLRIVFTATQEDQIAKARNLAKDYIRDGISVAVTDKPMQVQGYNPNGIYAVCQIN